MRQRMGTRKIETHASECTQCPVSSSSSTTPGNISCIIGKLCLLIYLLVYRSARQQDEWKARNPLAPLSLDRHNLAILPSTPPGTMRKIHQLSQRVAQYPQRDLEPHRLVLRRQQIRQQEGANRWILCGRFTLRIVTGASDCVTFSYCAKMFCAS